MSSPSMVEKKGFVRERMIGEWVCSRPSICFLSLLFSAPPRCHTRHGRPHPPGRHAARARTTPAAQQPHARPEYRTTIFSAPPRLPRRSDLAGHHPAALPSLHRRQPPPGRLHGPRLGRLRRPGLHLADRSVLGVHHLALPGPLVRGGLPGLIRLAPPCPHLGPDGPVGPPPAALLLSPRAVAGGRARGLAVRGHAR